jgi:hypothetical protein
MNNHDEDLDEPLDMDNFCPISELDEATIRQGIERLAIMNYNHSDTELVEAVKFLSAIALLIETDVDANTGDIQTLGRMLDIVLKEIFMTDLKPDFLAVLNIQEDTVQEEPYGV